ncbi:putative F-box domain, leucine-rich repeat domain superfamily, F-box-like domain superfamily [Helianthus anomalus]
MDCYTTRMDERLSGLSDDLILKILSFVSLKDVVRTSVLSHRWRHLWTSIPHLSFSSQDFSSMRKLSKSVTRVLSRRNTQVQLSSFDLYLHGKPAHGLYSSGNWPMVLFADSGIPSFSLSSQTLKHLTLKRSFSPCDEIVLTSAQEFSSLTTLHLHFITLYDGFLSMCPNLKNMTLVGCKVTGSRVLMICHPRLSNLTI